MLTLKELQIITTFIKRTSLRGDEVPMFNIAQKALEREMASANAELSKLAKEAGSATKVE